MANYFFQGLNNELGELKSLNQQQHILVLQKQLYVDLFKTLKQIQKEQASKRLASQKKLQYEFIQKIWNGLFGIWEAVNIQLLGKLQHLIQSREQSGQCALDQETTFICQFSKLIDRIVSTSVLSSHSVIDMYPSLSLSSS